jgi:hypothetical protein
MTNVKLFLGKLEVELAVLQKRLKEYKDPAFSTDLQRVFHHNDIKSLISTAITHLEYDISKKEKIIQELREAISLDEQEGKIDENYLAMMDRKRM